MKVCRGKGEKYYQINLRSEKENNYELHLSVNNSCKIRRSSLHI
jgi:hypothetical protein